MKMIVTVRKGSDGPTYNVEVEVDREMTAAELAAEAIERYNAAGGNEDPDHADIFPGVLDKDWATIFWGDIVSAEKV